MAMTIWKFPLRVAEVQEIEAPEGAQIMHIREHGIHAQPHAWIACDPDAPKRKIKIAMCGTGHNVPPGEYVGTAFEGGFVWHYFKQ